MSRRQALLAVVLAMPALAGCGTEEPAITETERTLHAAYALTVETRQLQRAIAAAADEVAVARSPERREEIEERLEEQRDRAAELAERTHDELPAALPVKDELEGTGERLAAAARDLRSFADSGDEEQLAAARTAIREAHRLNASAAVQLADRPPRELRELIDQLRHLRPQSPL